MVPPAQAGFCDWLVGGVSDPSWRGLEFENPIHYRQESLQQAEFREKLAALVSQAHELGLDRTEHVIDEIYSVKLNVIASRLETVVLPALRAGVISADIQEADDTEKSMLRRMLEGEFSELPTLAVELRDHFAEDAKSFHSRTQTGVSTWDLLELSAAQREKLFEKLVAARDRRDQDRKSLFKEFGWQVYALYTASRLALADEEIALLMARDYDPHIEELVSALLVSQGVQFKKLSTGEFMIHPVADGPRLNKIAAGLKNGISMRIKPSEWHDSLGSFTPSDRTLLVHRFDLLDPRLFSTYGTMEHEFTHATGFNIRESSASFMRAYGEILGRSRLSTEVHSAEESERLLEELATDWKTARQRQENENTELNLSQLEFSSKRLRAARSGFFAPASDLFHMRADALDGEIASGFKSLGSYNKRRTNEEILAATRNMSALIRQIAPHGELHSKPVKSAHIESLKHYVERLSALNGQTALIVKNAITQVADGTTPLLSDKFRMGGAVKVFIKIEGRRVEVVLPMVTFYEKKLLEGGTLAPIRTHFFAQMQRMTTVTEQLAEHAKLALAKLDAIAKKWPAEKNSLSAAEIEGLEDALSATRYLGTYLYRVRRVYREGAYDQFAERLKKPGNDTTNVVPTSAYRPRWPQ